MLNNIRLNLHGIGIFDYIYFIKLQRSRAIKNLQMKTSKITKSEIYAKVGRIKFFSKSEYDAFMRNKECSKIIDTCRETRKLLTK